MTKEEHDKLLTDLRQAETEADRINIINQLQDDYSHVLTECETATANYTKVVEERDKYARMNNEYWLKLQAQNTNIQNNIGQAGGNNEPPKKRSYDDLNFD